MPTILSHPAVPLALGLGLGPRMVSRRLLFVGIVASILPDLDVLSFRLNIAYSHAMAHRGFSHSLFFAAALALAALAATHWLQSGRRIAFVFIFIAAASHGVLDMFTNGGMGVALWWPWSEQRVFASWQVIEVSPLSLRRIFGVRGAEVFWSEFLWIWVPAAVAGAILYLAHRWILTRSLYDSFNTNRNVTRHS